ncbi:hypothetical protein Taro_034109 [Colocasia esculenta]|uniref:Uncharacterized protein n=1 Tax=Colocasia esculenta TaxID=4460 RepID=A0A843VVK8_COLES|nr:hypothetical protein [Colocasia esculenta]
MHTQIYSEPPPMPPYADSIGWLSEDPSTPVEQARMRISKEVATKPISQQAEEFVDHYHQLPSSIIQEAINATFENGIFGLISGLLIQRRPLFIKLAFQPGNVLLPDNHAQHHRHSQHRLLKKAE